MAKKESRTQGRRLPLGTKKLVTIDYTTMSREALLEHVLSLSAYEREPEKAIETGETLEHYVNNSESDVLTVSNKTTAQRTRYDKKFSSRGFNWEFLMSSDVSEQATLLAKKYGVDVKVVDTDNDFFSDTRIKESVDSKTYYVSAESPTATAQVTDWLIRYQAEKDRASVKEAQEKKLELLGIANEKRAEKSVQTVQDIAPKIVKISEEYSAAHNGKEPSLHKLADLLNEATIPAPGGSQSKWYAQTVKRILTAAKPGHAK